MKPIKTFKKAFSFVPKKLSSAAKLSKKPQLDHRGLGYAGQHLLLIIQHHVDAKKVKVQNCPTSWDILVELNPEVNLSEKKRLAKEICGIHHFSHQELEKIADRVSKFVQVTQPDMVIKD